MFLLLYYKIPISPSQICRTVMSQSCSLPNRCTQSLPSSAAIYQKAPIMSIPLHFVLLCCLPFPIVSPFHNIFCSSSVLIMLILPPMILISVLFSASSIKWPLRHPINNTPPNQYFLFHLIFYQMLISLPLSPTLLLQISLTVISFRYILVFLPS